MKAAIHISVVGHTNTGKTSFIRSVLRDACFGEVENRAGTTRHVEAVKLGLNDGTEFIFYDTPGMEDAIALLDRVDELRTSVRDETNNLIVELLKSEPDQIPFEQELKTLKQALRSELLIYVIDAREHVLGKYKDELQLLAMCGKPILPLLNFTAQTNHAQQWRKVLGSLGLHVVSDYDTVIYNQDHELQMLEQVKLLLHDYSDDIDQLIAYKKHQGLERTLIAKRISAEFLIDASAWQQRYLDAHSMDTVLKESRISLTKHEQSTLKQLLDVYQFEPQLLSYTPLDMHNLDWRDSVFDRQTWQLYGLDLGSAAAKGGAVGFTIDLLTGGLSLGIGTALGASAGLLLHKGREWKQKIQGYHVWRLDLNSLSIIYARQQLLLRTLSSTSHASIKVQRLEDYDFASAVLPKPLKQARFKSYWSRLNDNYKRASVSRSAAIEKLIEEL